MQFIDELQYLRLYSNKRKVYAPINPTERKKGAAIMLLTKSPVDSTTIMNLPYIHNPNLFTSLYIDRNVNAFIDSGAIIDYDDNDAVNEAMIHKVIDKDFKINIHTDYKGMMFATSTDIKNLKKVYKEENFISWYKYFGANINSVPHEIDVCVYPSVKDMAKAANSEAIGNGEVVLNSYSTSTSIHVVAHSGFDDIKKAEGGDYEKYLLNELITHVCMNTSKRCSRFMACQVATALSGQIDNKLADKIENDWSEIKDDSLAVAMVIKKIVDEEGPRKIKLMVKTGDYSYLLAYASRGFIKRISGLYEATLTATDRKNLSDSDYGLPKSKKYPMPDESHVRSAIRFFNHVDETDEAELAKNIKKKIKQYGMTVTVGDDNRFKKYYNESIVNENWIFSKDDIYINFEIWKPNKNNILYITGLSGSGKSTLAKEIADKYNAEYVELDILELSCFRNEKISSDYQSKQTELMKEYWNSTDHKSITGYGDPMSVIEMNNFNEWMIKNHKSNGKLYVLEGYQVTHIAPEYLVKNPLIIKGTSSVISTLRRGKRSFNRQLDKGNGYIQGFIHAIKDIRKMVFNGRVAKNEYVFNQFEEIISIAQSIQESSILEEGKNFNDVKKVVDSLSEKELNYICSGTFKDSPFVKYRDIHYENGEPVGFIDIYVNPESKNKGSIVIAVKEDARGKGIAKNLISKALKKTSSIKDLEVLEWKADNTNKESIALAQYFGFKFETKTSDRTIFSKSINESTIFEAGNKLFNLNKFTAIDLTYDNVKRCIDQAPRLKHCRTSKYTSGKIYLDNDTTIDKNKGPIAKKVVAFYNTERKDDGTVWIQALEVMPDYEDQGIGTLLLMEMIDKENVTHLSVNKKNERAKKIYDKNGFKVYDQTDSMYMMKLSESTLLESHNLTVKEVPTNNPNDPVSSKGVKLTFFNGKDKIGEASISAVDTDNGFLYDVEVFEPYRGKGYANDIMKYILKNYKVNELTVEPTNDIAINLYKKFGFKESKKFKENGKNMIDMKIHESVYIPLPTKLLTESFNNEGYSITDDYIMCDKFITFFNGMNKQVISEAEKKYDSKLKKYLFKERMRNNKTVLLRYQEMRAMSPFIKKTFPRLAMYQRRNLFIDLSYYHGIFLEKLQYKKDIAIKMYWDFLNRLLNDSEYKSLYNKITIFIPVYPDAWDTNDAEQLMDYKQSINPISMIIRMIRKNPAELKKWGNKDIVFVSPKGYFKVNFNNFQVKELAKFKRFITKLVSNEDIDDSEDGYTNISDSDTPAVITANIADKIEKNMGIKIDDITGGQEGTYKPTEIEKVLPSSAPKFDHLRIRTHKIDLPLSSVMDNKEDGKIKSTVFVMAPNKDAVIDTIQAGNINQNIWNHKSGYYKP